MRETRKGKCRFHDPMKTFIGGVGTVFKNIFIHLGRFFSGREGFGTSVGGIAHDFRKLFHTLLRKKEGEDEKRAKRYVKKGRLAYNQRRYEAAENAFREAILADAKCAIAYTFLGHTLYKMGWYREALVYWGKAVDIAPGTDAANKAQEKILFMKQKRNEANAWIEDRIQE